MSSTAKSPTTPLRCEDHFQNLGWALNSLKAEERFADLHFVCHFVGTCKHIMAHKAVLSEHSQFLTELFQISQREQPGDTAVITLDGFDPAAVESLLSYLYLGKATLTNAVEMELLKLCTTLGLKTAFKRGAVFIEESTDEVVCTDQGTTKKATTRRAAKPLNEKTPSQSKLNDTTTGKAKSKVGPKSKLRKANDGRGTSGSEKRGALNQKVDQSLKEKAMSSISCVLLEKIERSADEEVTRLLKKSASAKNLSSGKESVKPQKRRMADAEKKVELKDSKKMRPAGDDSSNSSSDVDQEKIASRKKEMPANRGGVRVKDSSSEEEEPQPKRASNARKAGPKGRKAKKYETVLPKAIFATQDLKYCGYCGKIFVSIKGLEAHVAEAHASDTSDSNDSSESSSEDTAEKKEMKRESDDSDATLGRKKPAKKIRQERQKSRRNASNFSSDDEEKDTNAEEVPVKLPIGRPLPGSKAKSTVRAKQTPQIKRRLSATSHADDARSARSHGGEGGVGCLLCPETFDKAQNLKNHVANHYKAELFAQLPEKKPFSCPDCYATSRDRITLMRHYAFTHKKIFLLCQPEELTGKILTGTTSNTTTPKKAGRGRGKPSKRQELATSFLSSDNDSAPASDNDSRKKTKSPTRAVIRVKVWSGAEKDTESLNGTEEGKENIDSVRFSDDTDEDLFTSSVAADAVKTFDELLNSEAKGVNGTENKGSPLSNPGSDTQDGRREPEAKEKPAGAPLSIDHDNPTEAGDASISKEWEGSTD